MENEPRQKGLSENIYMRNNAKNTKNPIKNDNNNNEI